MQYAREVTPKFIMLTLVSASCSTLHDAHRQPALRRFLIFVAHVAARLQHRRDHRVEADDVRAVADHRDAAGVDRLDRPHRVALDARDLPQPADRVAGGAEVMLHADNSGKGWGGKEWGKK